MIARWQDVRCASIPVEDLSVLADLRREAGIRVTIAQGRAWVCWEDGPDADATRRILVRRLLPLADVEVFARREGRWHRPGQHLPSFGVPVCDASGGVPLDRVILPEPLTMRGPGGEAARPVPLRLVRTEDQRARPATALRCRMADLAGWAQWAPSGWIESLSAACCATLGRGPGDAEVLLLGPAERLPTAADGQRFWGIDVLIPLGFRTEPPLAEPALRAAAGAGADDLVVLEDEGPELIPRRAFERLSRAAIRLAAASGPATGGGPP